MAMSVASLDRFRAASLVRRMNATKKDKNRHLQEELVCWSSISSTENALTQLQRRVHVEIGPQGQSIFEVRRLRKINR